MTSFTKLDFAAPGWRRLRPLCLLALAGAAAPLLAQTANQPPVARFASVQTPNTFTVQFDAGASSDPDGSIQAWTWNFGDGSTGSGARALHTYARDGKYSVKLTVTDDALAQGAATVVVPVGAPPVPAYTWKQYDGKLTVAFSAGGSTDSQGYIAAYAWDFGDGTTGSGRDTGHNYAAPGNYSARLTETDNFGNVSSVAFVVAVAAPNQLPVARFSSTQAPNTFQVGFDGTASSDPDGSITAWNWDFGDGGTATGPVASHTYAAAGSYSVKLTVTDNASKPAQGSRSAAVTVGAPPVPAFSWHQVDTGLPIVVVDGSASTDPQGHVAQWLWDWGDGTVGSGITANHGYAGPGDYTITLTAKDSFGNVAATSLPVQMKAKANLAPVARATAAQVNGRLIVNFDGSASSDPDGAVGGWAWDFGDGATSVASKPSHTYAAAGQYTATLTVTDNLGASGTVALPLTVAAINQTPTAWATATPSGTLGFHFDGSGSSDKDGSITSWSWDFGDNTSASGPVADHTYATPGRYRARLTVTDNQGATNTYALLLGPGMSGPATPWVTGYYGGWSWSGYQPQNIDMTALTHVVFGRAVPGGGGFGGQPGQVIPASGDAHDPFLFPAEITNKSAEDFLVERAHAAGARALLMLGGVSQGPAFVQSTTPEARPAFIANLLDYLVAHGYDGVDLNWRENLDATGTAQLIALVRELRDAAAQRTRYAAPNPPLLVTFQTGWVSANNPAVPAWKVTLAGLVDQFNVSTFQMSGPYGWSTWHFSPMYGQDPNHPTDLASTMQAYLNAGIAPSKLGIGIGFFGANFAPPATGPGKTMTSYQGNDFEWSYANLVNGGFLSSGEYTWDTSAQAAYRSYAAPAGFTGYARNNTSTAGFLTYEDPAAIAAKGKWVRDNKVGGTAIWLLNYGSPDGVVNPLLAAVKQAFLEGGANTPPTARFSATPDSSGVTVAFSGAPSSDSGNQPVASYRWDFGDGSSATGAAPTHTYASGGKYQVTLSVVDANGLSNSFTAVVQAVAPPPPDQMPDLVKIIPDKDAAPWVTGFYAGWFYKNYDPRNIDYGAMTQIAFGRIAPGSGTLGGEPGEVMPGAGTAHTDLIDGLTVENYIVTRAHQAGIKALLMLGGVGDGNGFLRSTAPDKRPVFVENLLDYLAKHDYDGLQVDWEDMLDTELAQFRLTALIGDLRNAALKHPHWSGRKFLITMPGYALNLNFNKVPGWKVLVTEIVDQYDLMTYGMGYYAQGWTTTTFAPLAGRTDSHNMDISSSIQAYADAGVNRKKLGIGIGFYGFCYAPPASGIDQPATPVSAWDVDWMYRKLVGEGWLSNGTEYWAEDAKMHYRVYKDGFSAKGKTCGMISYEDAASIAAKAAWVRNPATAVGGAILWAIDYGTVDGIDNPLLDAAKKGFFDTSTQ